MKNKKLVKQKTSHDLKGYLAVILAFSDLLERKFSKLKDEEKDYYISKIKQKVGEMVEYIDKKVK